MASNTSLAFMDQYSTDLKLNLIYEPLDKSSLTVLKMQKVDILYGFSIEAAVIGESHYVTLLFNNIEIFSELLACIDLSAQHKNLEILACTESNNFISHVVSDMHYAIDINIVEANQKIIEAFSKTSKVLVNLSYKFENQEYEIEAKTEIKIVLIEENLLIETLHSYPNENKIVLSRSSLDLEAIYLKNYKEVS